MSPNATRTDPVLRSFRTPIAHRLRLRIDALGDELRRARKQNRELTQERNSLRYQLRRAEKSRRELLSMNSRLLAQIEQIGKGGESNGITPELKDSAMPIT